MVYSSNNAYVPPHQRGQERRIATPQQNSRHKDTSNYAEAPEVVHPDQYRKEHSIVCDAGSGSLPDPVQTFDAAPFHHDTIHHLKAAGFPSPTPIQAQVWPVVAQGSDVVAVARTGSGKTLGFLLPALERLSSWHNQVLVVAPTRELAEQIANEGDRFVGHGTCCPIFGGVPKGPQIRQIRGGRARVIVATPGRLVDLIDMGVLRLDGVEVLVLDEADRMLDMGFEKAIERIVHEIPRDHQTLFFTATWPKNIQRMASRFLGRDAIRLRINVTEDLTANTMIEQRFVQCTGYQKNSELFKLLSGLGSNSRVIVFSNTKRKCEQLAHSVMDRNFGAVAIHGDKSQQERQWALNQFTIGRAPVMFATDVAARGLDIKGVTHVVNYDLPGGLDDYVHRIGRTGRAGATGISVTFCCEEKDSSLAQGLVEMVQRAGQEVPDFLRSWAMRGGRGGGSQWGRGQRSGGGKGYGGRRDGGHGGYGGQGRSFGQRDGGFGGHRDGGFGGNRDGGFGGHRDHGHHDAGRSFNRDNGRCAW